MYVLLLLPGDSTTPIDVTPARSLILKLLCDIHVCCPLCKRDVKVGAYDKHQYTPLAESSPGVSRDDFTGSIVRNSPAPLNKSRERCGDPYQRNC